MNVTPAPQVEVGILRKGDITYLLVIQQLTPSEPYSAVELAYNEVAEAQKALQEASERRTAINRIPKGKAGGGTSAKWTVEYPSVNR